MATATPIQLYEKVSEAEALSRNDHLNGQMIYQVSQEEALRRSARYERRAKFRFVNRSYQNSFFLLYLVVDLRLAIILGE